MNQTELISAVAEQAGLSKADAGKALEALVNVVTDTLKQGDEVRISGFGTFGISERSERQGRNPADRRGDHDRGVQRSEVHPRQSNQDRPQRRLKREAWRY